MNERVLIVIKNLRLVKALKDSSLCNVELNPKYINITCENDIEIMKQLQAVCNNVKGFKNYKICFANPERYSDFITV